jgi:hypothetical protein
MPDSSDDALMQSVARNEEGDLVRQFLNATGDARTVITDPKALYFGITVNDQSLTPGDHPRLGPTRFEDWLSSRSMAVAR